MADSKEPSEEGREPEDPFAPGQPPPGWTPSGPGQSWEAEQPAPPQWGAPPSGPIGPPQEQIPPEQVPPHWQQPYGAPPPGQEPPPGQQPPGQWGPPPGQVPYGQQPGYSQPSGQQPPYGQQPHYGQPGYGPPGFGPPGYAQPGVPGIPPGVQVGSLGKRLLARILDSLILSPVWIIVAIVTWNTNVGVQLLGTVVQTAIFFGYDAYFISTRGATIGKQALGLKVVQLANGTIPDQNAAGKRAALYNFSWIACYIGSIVVALSPLFDTSGRKQGLHDKFAGTVVIKA